MIRTALATVATTITLLLAGCVSSDPNRPGDPEQIDLVDDFFEPDHYEAADGELVKWTNVARGSHTVTVQKPGGANGEYLYNEELIMPGETVQFTFPGPGTYDVFCIYHSQGAGGNFSAGMVMTVSVA